MEEDEVVTEEASSWLSDLGSFLGNAAPLVSALNGNKPPVTTVTRPGTAPAAGTILGVSMNTAITIGIVAAVVVGLLIYKRRK